MSSKAPQGVPSGRFRRTRAGAPRPRRRVGERAPAAPASEGVAPGPARLRALAGKAIAVGAYLAVMGGLGLAAHAGRVPFGAFMVVNFVATTAVLFLPALDTQMGNAEFTPTRLTVYTMTGRRTLDLTALRRVRRLVMPTKGAARDIDLLFVTDARGVRVGLTSPDAVAAIGRSVTPQTRVSRRARALLDDRPVTVLELLFGYFLLPLLFFTVLWMLLLVLALGLAYPD